MVQVENFNHLIQINKFLIERLSFVKNDLLSMTIIDSHDNQKYEIFIKPDHIKGTLSLNNQELNLSLQSLMILPINEDQNIIKIVEY